MYNMDRKELLKFHQELVDDARGLMVKKNSDYADETSVFGNLDLIESLFCGSGRTTEEGIVIRLGDKLARLAKSTQRELKVTDESVRDTVKDMINYAVLFLAKKHERQQNAAMAKEMAEEFNQEMGWTREGFPLDSVAKTAHLLPHRVYIAGPYSNGGVLDAQERADNINIAVAAAKDVLKRGHDVHIPHSATAPLDGVLNYEQHMQHDLTLIQLWATGLFRILGKSKGADREVRRARELGIPVWFNIDDVPEVAKCESTLINTTTS